MRFFRKALLVLLALLLIAAVWVWWNYPRKVDMTAYVPADALIYLEANDLPGIASGVVSTDAWKALAGPAGIRSGTGNIGWLSRFVSWTGIGSADAVVLSRAQVAVAVMGFDATDSGEETLKIRPLYAVVLETHTGESRTRAAVESRVGDFARRAYGEPRLEQKEVDGVRFSTWVAPDGFRRIVAAVAGSVAVIGNDEAPVQACLAVRRNERPSLKESAQVFEMRSRLSAGDALAFGYVSPEGAAKLLEIRAITYAAKMPDPRAQSAAASILPPLARKILGAGGWSAHLTDGLIEDRYFVSLQNGLSQRLQETVNAAPGGQTGSKELLPGDTYSLSRYSYEDPARAWVGFNNALTSQMDTLGAVLVSRLLGSWLKPYGVDEPEIFLRAIGPEFVIANLEAAESSSVTIVEVRDEKTLRDFVSKRLGAKPRSETVGGSELLVSNDDRREAASFVGTRLILGKEQNVRRCLEARGAGNTLASAGGFQRAAGATPTQAPANVVTYTQDYDPADRFIRAIANQSGARERPLNAAQLDDALRQLRYSVSETRVVGGGFETRTRSSFGQFGALAAQFSPTPNTAARR